MKNIVLIMVDQLRADYIGIAKDSKMKTPNIDRIGKGVFFENMITVNPICQPARCALATGRYSHQIGLLDMSGDLSLDIPTFMHALQKNGYYTAGIGKLHYNQEWFWTTAEDQGHDLVEMEETIKKTGYDYLFEVAGKQLLIQNNCRYKEYLREKNLKDIYVEHVNMKKNPNGFSHGARFSPVDKEDYIDVFVGNKVCEFLDSYSQPKPFYLLASFPGPHPPFDPPQEYYEKITDPCDDVPIAGLGTNTLTEEQAKNLVEAKKAYKAEIMLIDEQIGRILDCLEQKDILKDTVIIFTCDHGEMLGDRGLHCKFLPYRQSVNVPAVIYHPDYDIAHTSSALCELTDITATILDVVGLTTDAISKKWPAFFDKFNCRSLLPILAGEQKEVRSISFSESTHWSMLENHEYKYIRYRDAQREELYHKSDVSELNNLVYDNESLSVIHYFRNELLTLLTSTPTVQGFKMIS